MALRLGGNRGNKPPLSIMSLEGLLQEMGHPEDLVGVAALLSSMASDIVNVKIIDVDGGLLTTVGRASSG